MNEVLNFLRDNQIFFLATDDGGQPRVRALGVVMEYSGRLAFCTGKSKNMYRQMVANPRVELCCVSANGTMLRVTGLFQPEEDRQARVNMLQVAPGLADRYAVDDGNFTVFSLKDAAGVFVEMNGETRKAVL